MTHAQLERLPRVFRDIVDTQRAIDDACHPVVVPFGTLRDLFSERTGLVAAATRIMRPSASTGGRAPR